MSEELMEKYEKKRETYINAIHKLGAKYDLYFGIIHRFDAHTTDSIGVVGDWNSPKLEWLKHIIELYDDVYFVYAKWEDEIHYCDACSKICDANPSFYGAELSYILINHDRGVDILCRDCFNIFDYLEVFLNNPKYALPAWAVKQAESEQVGFFPLECQCETGFHAGQTDDPEKTLKWAQGHYPGHDFLFHIIETSQFYVVWGILARKQQEN